MKIANLYIFSHRLYIVGSSKTVAGVWVDNDDVHVLANEVDDASLGGEIRSALEESRVGIPHSVGPSNAHEWRVLTVANASHSTFMRAAQAVTIEQEDHVFTIIPMRNRGAKGGFEPLGPGATRLEDPVDIVLGATVRKAAPP